MRVMSLYDIDLAIKVNDLKEVTSSRIYSAPNVFSDTGLMSETIFGQSVDDRMYRCGYIKLPIYIFNPDVAKTIIKRSGGIIKKCAYGETKCSIKNGVLVADDNGKICGFKTLYEAWDQIDVAKTLTTKNNNSLDILIKSPKRLLWTNKILVLPPYFRPIGERNGRPVKSAMNDIYEKFLGLKNITTHTSTQIFQVYNKIQETAVDLYTYIATYLGGKNGFLQRHMLAKNTQLSQRNVISAPKYNEDHSPIGIFRTGYPLHSAVGMFLPFVKFQMKNFLSYSNIMNMHPNKEEVNPSNIENMYDSIYIDELIKIYGKNPGNRFKKLYLDPEETKPIIFEYYDNKKKETVSRVLTLTDVVYISAKRAVEDGGKMALLTRYPIGSYKGTFFTKIHLYSTNHTTSITFQNESFPYYPIVDPDLPHNIVSTSFADTLTPSNSRLDAIGGDYDGDTVKSVGIWSDEANEEAEKLMYSKIFSIKPDCSSLFAISKGCLNGLYSATKHSF